MRSSIFRYSVLFFFFLLLGFVIACGSSPEETANPDQLVEEKPAEQAPPEPAPTQNANLVKAGTYLVGSDISTGYYRGEAGTDIFDSCYWARLKDLSGELDSIIANDNSFGQFYIQVADSDYALEVKCVIEHLETLPEPAASFPASIDAGMYLVGIDIQPGLYKGLAGEDVMESCYWARLKDLSGSLTSIIANDNATGQYYVEVGASDFALQTRCELTLAE